jgi:quercetin dioxygenase-like cupin family protein
MKAYQLNKTMLGLIVLAGLVIFSLIVSPVAATPSSGLTAEPVASGNLHEAVRLKFKDGEGGFGVGTDVKTIMVVKYTLAPGGTFGWHQHSGPVWAVVKSGTFSIYNDETCTPMIYPAGSVLLDPGNHTHMGINETSEPVEIYATFMLPEGGLPRLDAPDPNICN